MLVMKTVSSTLQHTTSTVVPILTTRIKMGLRISIVKTLSMPSVGWRVINWLVTILIPINVLLFVAALFVITQVKKRSTLLWSWPWSILVP